MKNEVLTHLPIELSVVKSPSIKSNKYVRKILIIQSPSIEVAECPHVNVNLSDRLPDCQTEHWKWNVC